MKDALLFGGGIVTGIVLMGVTEYILLPKIAERVSVKAVELLAREAGVSNALIAPFTPLIGRAVNQAVREELA